MEPIEFENAYYVKLGRKGKWEKSSIEENIIRIGWPDQTLEDINQGNWEEMERQLRQEIPDKGAATRDLNALRLIVESTSDDVWITFYSSHLWWCQVGEQRIYSDEISKYRKVAGQWHNCDINGTPLIISRIPGRLSKVQRFAGTVCRVHEIDDLRRLLNVQPSEAFRAVSEAMEVLAAAVEEGLKLLHWKDFETLTDLIFRNAGWRRISLVGETMKHVDIELEEPITGELYQVQVKSTATVADFERYAKEFAQGNFRKLYFVVHSPMGELANCQPVVGKNVELILPERLAQMVIEFGLVGWFLKKIR